MQRERKYGGSIFLPALTISRNGQRLICQVRAGEAFRLILKPETTLCHAYALKYSISSEECDRGMPYSNGLILHPTRSSHTYCFGSACSSLLHSNGYQ